MKLKLAISPCPNDTFMFYRLLHDQSLISEFSMDVSFADIEELNKKTMLGAVDVCKISFNTYPIIAKEYQILTSGSALGRNCGPLIIARKNIAEEELIYKKFAIPGFNTTAHFLLQYAIPELKNKTEVLFSEIEDRVLDGTYDCGVIIHENRFTYQDKGLVKIIDLGEHWEQKTGFPIPLGCIVIRRNLDKNIKKRINFLLRQSILYAFDYPENTMEFVSRYAQEMDPIVMKQHIDLYVNQYSLNLGDEGKKAINHLFEVKNTIQEKKNVLHNIFIES